jgi:hypothetical protein
MLTIRTALLNQVVHKYRLDGFIRVLCQVILDEYGLIYCVCDEPEFPIQFLPLLVDNEISISTTGICIDEIIKTTTNDLKVQTNINTQDLIGAFPSKVLPFVNQPIWVQAQLFNNLQTIGGGFQSLINWAPEIYSPTSKDIEIATQVDLLERLYEESEIDQDSQLDLDI